MGRMEKARETYRRLLDYATPERIQADARLRSLRQDAEDALAEMQAEELSAQAEELQSQADGAEGDQQSSRFSQHVCDQSRSSRNARPLRCLPATARR